MSKTKTQSNQRFSSAKRTPDRTPATTEVPIQVIRPEPVSVGHSGGVHCPACGSGECRRFEMILESGISDTLGESVGGGIGMAGLRPVVMVGGIRNKGTVTSRLAARVAPPERRSIKAPVVLAVLLFLVLPVFAASAGADNSGMVIALIGVALALYWAYRKVHWNHTRWPVLYERWRRQWMCLACGTEFVPEPESRPVGRTSLTQD